MRGDPCHTYVCKGLPLWVAGQNQQYTLQRIYIYQLGQHLSGPAYSAKKSVHTINIIPFSVFHIGKLQLLWGVVVATLCPSIDLGPSELPKCLYLLHVFNNFDTFYVPLEKSPNKKWSISSKKPTYPRETLYFSCRFLKIMTKQNQYAL